jgi:hypothetical protein
MDNTPRLVSRQDTSDILPGTNHMTFDDLYHEAQQFGEISMGGICGCHIAEIRLNMSHEDFVIVKSKTAPTAKENLALCIVKARELKTFYQQQAR